jgi:isopentenyl-diphosphate delta-isomerase
MELTEVILVDASDNATGSVEKMLAHEQGLLHRAFSIFIFNANGEMLLQRRAMSKYHSGGLWTNACCSHPVPGEQTMEAAQRRLKEELGFETPIHKVFDFVYSAKMDNGLTEHEFDHVFAGEYEGDVGFNKEEVMDYCYKSIKQIHNDLENHPQKYTAWFHIAFPMIERWWKKEYRTKPDQSI